MREQRQGRIWRKIDSPKTAIDTAQKAIDMAKKAGTDTLKKDSIKK
jgi:hypothetical protein